MLDQDDLPEPGGAYKPIWARPGNTVLEKTIVGFVDRTGNRGVSTTIRYRNKKGKIIEVVGFIKWIHIIDPPLYPPISHRTITELTEN